MVGTTMDVNCGTCYFWEQTPYDPSEGRCRRHSPTVHLVTLDSEGTQAYSGIWPPSLVDDWCGEYARKD